MKIEKWRHEGVQEDGTVITGGAVHTEPIVRVSPVNGGCGIETCHCSDGHWLTVGFGRTEDGVVEGVKVQFDNLREMSNCLGITE